LQQASLASWLAQNGADLNLIGSILNHKDISTTQVYARFGRRYLNNVLTEHEERLFSNERFALIANGKEAI
jgi:site-specific recombinase XerD